MPQLCQSFRTYCHYRQSETLSDPERDFESSFKVYRNLLVHQSHQSWWSKAGVSKAMGGQARASPFITCRDTWCTALHTVPLPAVRLALFLLRGYISVIWRAKTEQLHHLRLHCRFSCPHSHKHLLPVTMLIIVPALLPLSPLPRSLTNLHGSSKHIFFPKNLIIWILPWS